MDAVGFLTCFIVVMIELFSKTGTDPVILVGGLIGLGLCSIAGAINEIWRNRK